MKGWPDNAVAVLREGYRVGWTASRTAREIEAATGIAKSRGAVIGKAHRLGIVEGSPCQANRAAPAQRKPYPPRPRKPKPPKAPRARAAKRAGKFELYTPDFQKGRRMSNSQPVAPMRRVPGERATIGLLQLGLTTCRWPIGDPMDADFGFCGCRCPADRPYCDEHAELARPKDAAPAVKAPRKLYARQGLNGRAARARSPWDLDYGERAA